MQTSSLTMDTGGWDAGQVYAVGLNTQSQMEESREGIEQKFLDFLRTFRLDTVFTYR